MHPSRPARACIGHRPLHVLWPYPTHFLRRCGPADGLCRAAVGLRVARHEEELPYEGVARAVREHRGCAHAVEYVLVYEHLVRG